jgi:Gas vesicle synthesis protein GvpL/GvpF
MSAQTRNAASAFGWYIYGIVDSDVSLAKHTTGVGDPPTAVEVVSSGPVASLVSKIPVDRPIGSTNDLLAHQRVLDDTAVHAPVLPVRFGAVVDSREAITEELLGPNEATFDDLLRDMTGQAQYVLRARYGEDGILREIVEENPAIMTLREQIEGRPAEATRAARMKLGQIVNEALENKRRADTRAAMDLLAASTSARSVRQPGHELDAANIAMLVAQEREEDMERALNELAEMWRGRATVRLIGPMAPYDFVAVPVPDGQKGATAA